MSDRHAGLLAAVALAVGSAIAASAACGQTPLAAAATGVDASVRPGDDFYAYANGPWIKATPMPEAGARLDTSAMLRAENARRVQGLIADAGAAASPDARKVADYHASWLDRAGIEARGFAPLSADLAVIAAIADRSQLAAYLGRTMRLDDGANQRTESLLGVWVHQGFHDPDHYAAHLVQGGLGLAEREDYLDPGRAERRALYLTHVAGILRAAGFDQAQARAARVVELETAIAATHASRADTDDVFKTDNSWSRADFAAKAPGMDWAAYFTAARLDPANSFVVWQPQAVVGAAKLVADQPLEAWRDYLAFHLVEHYAGVLPKTIADEDRAFEAQLAGAAQAPAADFAQEAAATTQAALGDAVGRLYVERYFPPQAKAAATAMTSEIVFAYRGRIAGLTWMGPETKAKALAKLAALRVGLGYPESWIDYAPLAVVRGDALGNLRRAEDFAYRLQTDKLSRQVDPDEWAGGLHPQQVNAILNISPNTMQFAAGLLQPPYFDPAGDAASNYGSAGAGIAHEISHSFDELGNLYDAGGRLGQWWTAEDIARYRAAAAPLAAQLDACCPTPDACAHGRQVLAESVADLAGLAGAHDAYLSSLHGRPDVVKGGLTGEQRFFVAYAQRWRRLQSDAALRRQIETDSHAPPQCRSNLVRNVEAWDRAFDVKAGDRLYLKPADRVQVW